MAVEAAHLNLFLNSLNKQTIMTNAIDNANVYNHQFRYATLQPLSGTTTAETLLLPMYASAFTNSIHPDPLKPHSGLTNTSRKRSRESSSLLPFSKATNVVNRNPIDRFTFLGQDISSQIQQQQLEIDQFVSSHSEKVRMDLGERRKRNSRTIISALEEGVARRLREKEEEIVKMGKLNWALEEKVKSLCMENQIWRELAQTNEATANALRGNLKQVLEQVIHDDYRYRSTTAGEEETAVVVADDAQSCCESSGPTLEQNSITNRWCKSCGKAESCVLLLPCRHLCLCTVCASSVNICPICKSTKNISVQVNHMS